MEKNTPTRPDSDSIRPDHWNKKPRTTPEPAPVLGCRWLPLTRGLFALVDEQDFEGVAAASWAPSKTKCTTYARNSKKQYLHRLIMNAPAGMEVDHRNGDGLDCRRSNLRVCTAGQNRCNMRKTTIPKTSRFKGVCWDRTRNKWRATIKLHRQWTYLGRFDNEIDAAKAFDMAARELFGEFALLNFPVVTVMRTSEEERDVMGMRFGEPVPAM